MESPPDAGLSSLPHSSGTEHTQKEPQKKYQCTIIATVCGAMLANNSKKSNKNVNNFCWDYQPTNRPS